MDHPLIAALATAEGRGGIAIIRLSGDGAWSVIEQIFQPRQPFDWSTVAGYSLHYVYITYEGAIYDEVLVALMKEHASYTREQMAEIQCHGGFISARRILELLMSLGVAMAGPGEFTKRAFLSGRLDLSQAEAVIETIEAQGDRDLDFSLRRLEGKKGQRFLALRESLLSIIAETEAVIDFPEDGLDDSIAETIGKRIGPMIEALDREIKKAEEGRVYKEGLSTVILGRTNVGKSSLLNALLSEERAIVTDIPGTTRDTIEETAIISGVPLKIVDTAGIRETLDPVEKIGVDRSREAIHNADLVLFVLDGTEPFSAEDGEILQAIDGKKTIVLLNKCDLPSDYSDSLREAVAPLPVLEISAKEERNLKALGDAIRHMFLEGEIAAESGEWVGNLRHKEVFLRAKHHLEEVLKAQEMALPLDFQVIDLRAALEALGEISGESISTEIIDRIFSDFCIGK